MNSRSIGSVFFKIRIDVLLHIRSVCFVSFRFSFMVFILLLKFSDIISLLAKTSNKELKSILELFRLRALVLSKIPFKYSLVFFAC